MLDDAVKALSQMLSPPLRAMLWKSIGLALALIVVVAIALDRLILWLVGAGSAASSMVFGPQRICRLTRWPGCSRSRPASASSSAACC